MCLLRAPPRTLCTLLNETLLRRKPLPMSLQIGFLSKHQLGLREHAAIMVLPEKMGKAAREEIKELLARLVLTEKPAKTGRTGKTELMEPRENQAKPPRAKKGTRVPLERKVRPVQRERMRRRPRSAQRSRLHDARKARTFRQNRIRIFLIVNWRFASQRQSPNRRNQCTRNLQLVGRSGPQSWTTRPY